MTITLKVKCRNRVLEHINGESGQTYTTCASGQQRKRAVFQNRILVVTWQLFLTISETVQREIELQGVQSWVFHVCVQWRVWKWITFYFDSLSGPEFVINNIENPDRMPLYIPPTTHSAQTKSHVISNEIPRQSAIPTSRHPPTSVTTRHLVPISCTDNSWNIQL